MSYERLAIDGITVNPANDRHGELANETAAIAELFRLREAHMKRLAADIVEQGEVYDPPLVLRDGDDLTVFDGNRRVTCLKLIRSPHLGARSRQIETSSTA